MGAIVAAGLLSHVPGIMLPEAERRSEGFFAHYSMLAGALGGEACRAQAAQYGEYENAIGTGQAMLWFPL